MNIRNYYYSVAIRNVRYHYHELSLSVNYLWSLNRVSVSVITHGCQRTSGDDVILVSYRMLRGGFCRSYRQGELDLLHH